MHFGRFTDPMQKFFPESSARNTKGLTRAAMQKDHRVPRTKVQIKKDAGLDALEAKISAIDALSEPVDLSMSIDERGAFFREQWLAMMVAAACRSHAAAKFIPWGHQQEPDLDDDESWAFSLPFLVAFQKCAEVWTDGPAKTAVPPSPVCRAVWERRAGVLGQGGRSRKVFEFDPESPVALTFQEGSDPAILFRHRLRGWLNGLEIGASAHGGSGDHGAKAELLSFITELRANGFEHSSRQRGVRMLRLQKHLSPNRDVMLAKAASFPDLAAYVRGQPASGPINLVEVSVSDFGPGILKSFLDSFKGKAHRNRPPTDVLRDLIHTQLSAKSDPGSGLGIPNALAAARRMSAFVSLRTGEQWLIMDGSQHSPSEMTPLQGAHAHVEGTHWQLIYPDPIGGASTSTRA